MSVKPSRWPRQRGVTETDCAVPGNGDDERDMRSDGGRGKPEDLNGLGLLEEQLLI